MKLQHKTIGLLLWGQPADPFASDDLAAMIAAADRTHRQAVARMEALERRLAKPARARRIAARDFAAERAALRAARRVVDDRLAELQRLHELLARAPAGGRRWSGRDAVVRVPDKPRLP